MILLVTPSERGRECSVALQQATGEPVTVAESLALATTILRSECCLAVVLDQQLLENNPQEAASTYEHMGAAIPVHINLAISGIERLLREVRSALQRRHHEEVKARQVVLGAIRGELNGTVTALLLSTELALAIPNLPALASEKLVSVCELIKKLRTQLESAATAQEGKRAAGV